MLSCIGYSCLLPLSYLIYGRKNHQEFIFVLKTLFKPALVLAALIISAGTLYNLSLNQTTPDVNNTIYQSQCIFVYVISALLMKNQTINKRKSFAVTCTFAGVFILTFSSGSNKRPNSRNTLTGITFVAAATMCASLYEIFSSIVIQSKNDYSSVSRINSRSPSIQNTIVEGNIYNDIENSTTHSSITSNEHNNNVHQPITISCSNSIYTLILLGINGIVSCGVLYIVVIVADKYDLEKLEMPKYGELWFMILLWAFCDVLYNICVIIALS
eukprot:UN34366